MRVLAKPVLHPVKQWHKHGDSQLVQPATPEQLASAFGYVPNPEKLVVGIMVDGLHQSLVLPGDWIVSVSGRVLVFSDSEFQKIFSVFARCISCGTDKGCCDEPK